MIRISSDQAQILANVLHQRSLDDVAGIKDDGDSLLVSFHSFSEEQIVMDDLDYEHVQFTFE